jgi:uroporphyrinogen-III synthase
MQKTKRYILSTRPLPKPLVEEAEAQGIIIEELSFIQTKPVEDAAVMARIKELAQQEATVVFTSMNAVEAVAAQIDAAPRWKLYTLENTTRTLAIEKLRGAQLVAVAEDSKRLGERMIDDGVQSVVFFCGNIRRDELPNKFRSEKVPVEEIVVYETEETPSSIDKEYDAILFFSPSAVNAFFKINKPAKETRLFAIGNTTAEAIRQYSHTKIIKGNTADKVELARDAIRYFTANKQD